MKKIFHFIFCAMLSVMSSSSYAFKIDTHIWIGQQIINDLKSNIPHGQLTFNYDFDEFGNSKEVKIPIVWDTYMKVTGFFEAFLLGNMGPDATPDMIVGQSVIHPGINPEKNNADDWKTNQWLMHMRTYAYLLMEDKGPWVSHQLVSNPYYHGVLAHAAADVFAHTYVNQYSGDVFDLNDGETLVEQRHYVLEGFISKHTPPLKNHKGDLIGEPWEVVQSDANTTGDLVKYSEYVRDVLIYNDDVQEQYLKVPTATHLAAFYEFRKGIDNLEEKYKEIDNQISKYLLPFIARDSGLNSILVGDFSELNNLATKVLEELNKGNEDIRQLVSDLEFESRIANEKIFNVLKSTVLDVKDLEKEWVSTLQKWREKLIEVASLPAIPVCPKIFDKVCEEQKRIIEQSNKLIIDASNALENKTLSLKNDLIDRTIDITEEIQKIPEILLKIDQAIAELEKLGMGFLWPKPYNKFDFIFINWKERYDTAMSEYVKASTQSMINAMNPNASALEPMAKWFECHHLSIIGLPGQEVCGIKNMLGEIHEAVKHITKILDQANILGSSLPLPTPSDLLEFVDKEVQSLVDKFKAKAIDQLPENVKQILTLLDEDITDETLNKYFTIKETGYPKKGLIQIPNMAKRIKAEMHLTPDGHFDPKKYPVIYNALVMAKLSLLDKEGFTKLAEALNVTDHTQYMGEFKNIVGQAFKNIDVGYQWMENPPPVPNSLNKYNLADIKSYSTDFGFLPWKGDMRDKMFRKLFIGPLSPGIDSPKEIGFSNIVGSQYPYKVCSANPFPDDIYDKRCLGEPNDGGNGGGGGSGEGGSCASESATQKMPYQSIYLKNLRSFRDNELSQSENGQKITQLYYKHSKEVKEMMKKDVYLRLLGIRLILRSVYAFNPKQVKKDVVPLDKNYSKLAIRFLEQAQKNGSEELVDDFNELKVLVGSLKGLTAQEVLDEIKSMSDISE
ncbi:MAG: hypothetical protein HN826_00945 [Methylococcales bacterium]|jgi:hypothetical protein|nr:hypothetical protein [Methylococcales bacterium]